MNFIKEMEFDHSFSFLYSKRPGTPAAQLDDTIPLSEKKQRLAILQQQVNKQGSQISSSMVNTHQRILVTGSSKKTSQELCGRTENNRVVNFSGPSSLIGQMISVKITAALTNSLRGKYLTKEGQ